MGKIAFLFSGQGAQHPGMSKELCDRSPAARRVFDLAGEVLGWDVAELCFHGAKENLDLTRNTQPCMLAADLAAWAAVTEQGLRPDAVAGFSLGEYAALTAAGVLDMGDVFRMIEIRADAMQRAVPPGRGAMAAVMKLSLPEVETLCGEAGGYVVPANLNSPVQIVVAGETETVDRLLTLTKERKIRAVRLPVSVPSHCGLMEPARAELEETFRAVRFRDASVPVYMNVDGKVHREAEDIRQCLLRQLVSPVRWVDTVTALTELGVDRFLELGVGRTLESFVKKTAPQAAACHVEDPETLEEAMVSFQVRQ